MELSLLPRIFSSLTTVTCFLYPLMYFSFQTPLLDSFRANCQAERRGGFCCWRWSGPRNEGVVV